MGDPPPADRECIPCTGDEVSLTGEELTDCYEQLDSDIWRIVNEHHLTGRYEFEDFRDALEFTKEIGEFAEKEWHHPDIYLSWGQVVIEQWTHTIDRLFETDFIVVARFDRIYESYVSRKSRVRKPIACGRIPLVHSAVGKPQWLIKWRERVVLRGAVVLVDLLSVFCRPLHQCRWRVSETLIGSVENELSV